MGKHIVWSEPSRADDRLSMSEHAHAMYQAGMYYYWIGQVLGVSTESVFRHIQGKDIKGIKGRHYDKAVAKIPEPQTENLPHHAQTRLQLDWEGYALELIGTEKGGYKFKMYTLDKPSLSDIWADTHNPKILDSIWERMASFPKCSKNPSLWAYDVLRCDLYELLIAHGYIKRYEHELPLVKPCIFVSK